MITPNSIATASAAVSALSTFGVLVVTLFGLRQLTLAKRGLELSAKIAREAALRESYTLAADQCRIYLNELVPLLDKCDQEMNSTGLNQFLASFSVELNNDGIHLKLPDPLPKDFMDVVTSSGTIDTTLPVHNALESFAVLFTNGVASEEVAFASVGRSFCYNFAKHLPLILPYAGTPEFLGSGAFQNALRLFMIWQRRLNQQKLLQQQQSLTEQLGKTRDIKIKPIGT